MRTWSCSPRAHARRPSGSAERSTARSRCSRSTRRSAGRPSPAPVLFVDLRGDLESALCAEHVAAAGAELTLVTPYLSVGPNLGFTHLADVVGRLARLGASLEASTAFAGIAARQALTRHLYTRELRSRPFAVVVAGVHGRSDTSLAAVVEQAGVRLLVAGDAVAPRTALHAFREGDDVGRAV